MRQLERVEMLEKHAKRIEKVWVKGTGVGTVLERIGDWILIQFDHALAWVDSKKEEVKVCSFI